MATRERLNRPRRWAIVTAEVLVAAAAVLGAVLLWRTATVQIGFTLTTGRTLEASRFSGAHAGGAIGLCVLAGWLLLDALRQSILAARAGHRRKEPQELERYQQLLAEEHAHGKDPVTPGDGRHVHRPA